MIVLIITALLGSINFKLVSFKCPEDTLAGRVNKLYLIKCSLYAVRLSWWVTSSKVGDLLERVGWVVR